jgi:AraC-like DNA-binding protein
VGNRVFDIPADAHVGGLCLLSMGMRRIDPPGGQDLERDAQDHHGLTCVVHGEADFLLPAPRRLVRSGDVIVLPAGIAHRYRSTDGRGWRALWIRFTCDRLGLPCGPLSANATVHRAWATLLGLIHAPGPREAAALATLLAELALAQQPQRTSDAAIDAAAAALRQDPLRAWDLPALARRHGLSYSALRQGLRRRTGLAPARLLREARLRLVAEALADGAPVALAARRGGFADPFHCSRLFRHLYGCPPSAWRRQHDA